MIHIILFLPDIQVFCPFIKSFHMAAPGTVKQVSCAHCGESCISGKITFNNRDFCCEGCQMVYQLLNQNGLCDYYDLNKAPGITLKKTVRENKFAFLEDTDIQRQLISYADDKQVHTTFYIPAIHCSSCLYLLENLHKLNAGIISGEVNFPRKELSVVYNPESTTLRKVVELLTSIGYEPYLSLNDLKGKKPRINRGLLYRLGVAFFCFGNIMLLSFPEYLGLDTTTRGLGAWFSTLNILLSLPVFVYSANPFYKSAWLAFKKKFLNIDVPITIALWVIFFRSLYEILSGTGAGYMDSLAGIVFFMLIGRVLQDKTYANLSFERDFSSYFPIAVSVVKEEKEIPTPLPDIKTGDTLRIHNEELIPADGIITRGKAYIDYSFVTGESTPVEKEMGEIVYAGGKQVGGVIETLVIKEVSQSYLTRLWSAGSEKEDDHQKNSLINYIGRYFTVIVLSITIITGIYWWIHDPSMIFPTTTAILIITCPCAFSLAGTFTNGHFLNILSKNKLFVKSAPVLEKMNKVTHIVFDKTGTLTETSVHDVQYEGIPLEKSDINALASLFMQSTHPLSKAVLGYIGDYHPLEVEAFEELPGRGLQGCVNGKFYKLGSSGFVAGIKNSRFTSVYVSVDDEVYGKFIIKNYYRESVPALMQLLSKEYNISVISGDNASERDNLMKLTGGKAILQFNQKPTDKLEYIKILQEKGDKVLMIGDGLNDAGALLQSDVGIAITSDSNNFTPASDAIMEARSLRKLPGFLKMAHANKRIIITALIFSFLYNIVGISFAAQGMLSPLVAAVLMPASSITIMLISYGSSLRAGKRLLK